MLVLKIIAVALGLAFTLFGYDRRYSYMAIVLFTMYNMLKKQ